MEIPDVRRRVRQMLERARRASAERRARVDAAARAYESFLSRVATPVFRMFATAIRAEGHAFAVFTPAGGLRLASERSADDYIELLIDTESDPPTVAARINRGRGGRLRGAGRFIRPPIRPPTSCGLSRG